MESLGLMPSATAAPRGKRTGDRMSHYIIEGGPFARAFAEMTVGTATDGDEDRCAA